MEFVKWYVKSRIDETYEWGGLQIFGMFKLSNIDIDELYGPVEELKERLGDSVTVDIENEGDVRVRIIADTEGDFLKLSSSTFNNIVKKYKHYE